MATTKQNSSLLYFVDGKQSDELSLEQSFRYHLESTLVKDKTTATKYDAYRALVLSIRDMLIRKWLRTQHEYARQDVKKVYYLSMEFLMGRLLGTTLINVGFYDECARIMSEMGYNLHEICEVEKDMGLGNGGLGRLAACFLDSMATLELPAFGYGIRYEYGIFDQDIENGYQIEKPDNWLGFGTPWDVMRPEYTYRVHFEGQVAAEQDGEGRWHFNWVHTNDVLAIAYDVPVPGYKNNTVNSLRLWQAKSTNDFDLEKFNEGDFIKAVEGKSTSENISKVLYPNDNFYSGKVLRLQQQFFFVSAALQDIIRQFKKQHNNNWGLFPEKVAIQLNDTHPAIAIPELMRLLMDVEKLLWRDAWSIVTRTFAYTNHTVLSEALERWSVSLLERMLPRHLQIIREINKRFLHEVAQHWPHDANKIAAMSIIEEGSDPHVRMAYLAIVASYSVNGVAELHTHILKTRLFADFYEFFPQKFNNKTNGITQRRWLEKANPALAHLVTARIGSAWCTDLYELKKIERFCDDPEFAEQWRVAKRHNKAQLFQYVQEQYGIALNPHSMVDAQIKRLHEYKRQLLNVLHVITLYNRIKDNPHGNFVPRTVLFAGKAAPGYHMAKLTIKLINSVADVVNNDSEVGDRLKVLFLKNYSVTLAERIIPATDLSEQISTAGFEASGTGNMKFQLNGALTIGTMDGANIEMREEVGPENIFIFGLGADEVTRLKSNGYQPREYYERIPMLQRVIDMISASYFAPDEPGIFAPIVGSLLQQDYYCLLADYEAYIAMQERVEQEFCNEQLWTMKSIANTARVGRFSSDRTIRQYAEEIWNASSVSLP